MNEQEFLTGIIERITYHSETTGFCVLRVDVKGRAELVTVIGNAAQVTPGEYVNCHGTWIQNRDYGLQFKANTLSMLLPSTTEGLQKYLGSGLIKGIGPHFSKQLITAFGDQIFDIIENHPEKLHQVTGIGEQRVNMITHSWKTQRVVREIMVFLQEYGVGTARAVRIYKTYGSQSIAKVRENPYCLALDIHGIGFKTADALAQRLGIGKESQIRAEAGVRHVLQEFSGLGHCAVLHADLVEKTQTLLEIPAEIIERALTQEIASKRVVSEHYPEGVYLALSHLYRAELGVVKHIKRLLRYPAMWLYPTIEACDLIQTQIEHTLACRLSVSQHHAMQVALQNKLMIITGGPGVGKTTLVNSILHAVRAQGARIVLCAPTGRAAKRLSESTGLEAKTLHRLLEFDPKERVFKRSENQPLEADLIVIDEMSMVDITLMHHLLSALPNACGVLFVGDVDQLPSVGPGAVLRDLIGAQTIPMVKLTEIFRQAAHSQIILAAHKMNQGVMPLLENAKDQLSDFYFIACETPEEIHARLMEVVMHRIPKRFGFHPIRQIQVLVPMTRGSLGVRSLNVELQGLLNHNDAVGITRYGVKYTVEDKVIQTVNDYDKEVFNGDIGYIVAIDEEEGLLKINFDGRIILYEAEDLDQLQLAYATTIHKAQGSEYPAVVIPVTTQHYPMLERNLFYTGVTRGKSLVVMIGQKKALAIAIRTVRSTQRITHLVHRLQEI